MDAHQALSAKQHSIIPIAALTANGDLDKLRPALHAGLDAGLTVNEIKEILVQMYAYAGFPRSLNGITTFMAVMDERHAKGITDEVGKEASPVPAYQLFTPVIDTFLKEHLFADIFVRDNLDDQSRELATIAALASMTGTAGQLQFHLGAAMNTGLTEAQMKDCIAVLKAKVGTQEAESADAILGKVLSNRAQ